MAQQIVSALVASTAQVHVSVGQRVEAGDEVVLLELMKMEIPLLAEAGDGRRGLRGLGDVVQEGDVVVVLDARPVIARPTSATEPARLCRVVDLTAREHPVHDLQSRVDHVGAQLTAAP